MLQIEVLLSLLCRLLLVKVNLLTALSQFLFTKHLICLHKQGATFDPDKRAFENFSQFNRQSWGLNIILIWQCNFLLDALDTLAKNLLNRLEALTL